MLRQIYRGHVIRAREEVIPVLEAAAERATRWAVENFTKPEEWPLSSVTLVWHESDELVTGSHPKLRGIAWHVGSEGMFGGAWTTYTKNTKGEWWAINSGRDPAITQRSG